MTNEKVHCVWRSGCSATEQCRLERRCTRSNPEDREKDLYPPPSNEQLTRIRERHRNVYTGEPYGCSGRCEVCAVLKELDQRATPEPLQRIAAIDPGANMAIAVSRYLHDRWTNAPHDIGLRIMELIGGELFDARASQPPPAAHCNCGAHEWKASYVQIEDSRGRLHTERGCQPVATSTKQPGYMGDINGAGCDPDVP